MNIINFLSISAIPAVILVIAFEATIEKNRVFDDFVKGTKEGIKIVVNLFPTLIGLFVAIGVLRSSGIIELIVNLFANVFERFNIPKEIMPLAILRPISGSGAMAIATDIMNNYGVDTKIGKIASVIMGSTETTLYTIAIYTSCVNIKKTRGVLIAALIADIVGMIVSIMVCNLF